MAQRSTGFKGAVFALEGPGLKPGDAAPNFTVQIRTDSGLGETTLADFAGKTLVISVVPSLDTSVCALQTRKFNERASRLPDSVAILTVSADLPFAQGRFCGAEGIDKIQVASDHRDVSFGRAYGTLISDGPFKRILSRAVFVIGSDGIIKHVEYVSQVPDEPDYDAALAAAA